MPDVKCDRIENVLWTNVSPDALTMENSMHIWRAKVTDDDVMIDALPPILNTGEQEQAASYKQEKDRKQFIISRSMLRILLGQYLGKPSASVSFETGSNKKPYLLAEGNRPLHFSVSHSGDWVLIAVASGPVGIDVEQIAGSFFLNEALAECFSEQERNFVNGSAQPSANFYLLWTRKEALVKATTKGVDNDIALIPCLDGLHAVSPKIINSGENWQVCSFDVERHYIASIAYQLPIQNIRFREMGDILNSVS